MGILQQCHGYIANQKCSAANSMPDFTASSVMTRWLFLQSAGLNVKALHLPAAIIYTISWSPHLLLLHLTCITHLPALSISDKRQTAKLATLMPQVKVSCAKNSTEYKEHCNFSSLLLYQNSQSRRLNNWMRKCFCIYIQPVTQLTLQARASQGHF